MSTPSTAMFRFKLSTGLLVFVELVCLLSGCGKITTSRQPNTQSAWVRVSPNGGGFSVLMPGQPPEVITEHQTKNGTPVAVHNFVLNPDTPKEFAVIYNDFPIEVPLFDELVLFDTGQERVLHQFGKGRLIYSKDGSFGNNPMREIKFEVESEGKVRVFETRLILVKRRLYQLMVVSQAGDDIAKEVGTFFDSFKLEDQK